MDFKDKLTVFEGLEISRRPLIHYDPAISPTGEISRPSNQRDWDALGVKVELGRYTDQKHYEDRDPFDVSRFGHRSILEGLVTNIGSNLFWRFLVGATDPGGGSASVVIPSTGLAFNNTNCTIGVGTSSTAAVSTQTDLQAATGATNRQFKLMSNNTQVGTTAVPSDAPTFPLITGPRTAASDVSNTLNGGQTFPEATVTVNSTTGFPTAGDIWVGPASISPVPSLVAYTGTTGTTFTGATGGSGTYPNATKVSLAMFFFDATGTLTPVQMQQAIFRAPFLSGEGNFAWNEFGLYNDPAAATGNTDVTTHVFLDRFVSAQGTKAVGQVWEVTITVTLS